jgi:hypothetical protein
MFNVRMFVQGKCESFNSEFQRGFVMYVVSYKVKLLTVS